ncbi:hypothetical protein SISSUDRAFT_1043428 [Sistotremastrum suecicum HHB10207 ss-3]|uniref:Uncharacterized protein n=1 Tax=Sistotremastrum suecicum HHB10207 ss-3 TaxID=1314776 RepID=A0A166FRK0_9AGAM|nr:hypothetical protein SISSUDRAFT_1043428 [Sistotremastrum suecicum HHB10207 ss-3]
MPYPCTSKKCEHGFRHATWSLRDTSCSQVQRSTTLPAFSLESSDSDEKSIRSLALDRKTAQKASDRRKTKPSHKDRSNHTKEGSIRAGGRLAPTHLLNQAIWVEEDRQRSLRVKDDAACEVCENMNSEEDRRYLADIVVDQSSSGAREIPLVHILRPGKSRPSGVAGDFEIIPYSKQVLELDYDIAGPSGVDQSEDDLDYTDWEDLDFEAPLRRATYAQIIQT